MVRLFVFHQIFDVAGCLHYSLLICALKTAIVNGEQLCTTSAYYQCVRIFIWMLDVP